MSTATVSSKYQISLPKAVREAMQIQPSQQFEFIPMGNVLQLAPKTSIKGLRGVARGANPKNYRDRKDRATIITSNTNFADLPQAKYF